MTETLLPDDWLDRSRAAVSRTPLAPEARAQGRVTSLADGIARVAGLPEAPLGALLQFETGARGFAHSLGADAIDAVMLDDATPVEVGHRVTDTGDVLRVPVGEALLGRVVDPLGRPLDGGSAPEPEESWPVERPAPDIIDRALVSQPLETGVLVVDSLFALGRGQRELIVGDHATGKTALAVDAIINQKTSDVICVYVAIGQKASTVASVVQKLTDTGAMDYSIVVNASAAMPAPLQYIAPYAGCAMAEYFMYDKNGHALCVYDDLSKQAAAYRQLSLLLRRPPGREAYPGDVFYLHSRLLERSAKLSDDLGAGSLTALPVIETQEGEVSAYIPTNVISITDGQIYLVPELFFAGVRPAIDVGISVSRVGGSAQIQAMKDTAKSLRLDLAQFRELEAFAQLGTELDPATQRQLDRGFRMVEVLKQDQYRPMTVVDQILIIWAGTAGKLDVLPAERVSEFEEQFIGHVNSTHKEIPEKIEAEGQITDEIAGLLGPVAENFVEAFRSGKAADPRAVEGAASDA